MLIIFQSISPGVVQTEFAEGFPDEAAKEAIKEMPHLLPEDVANAVHYVLTTPPHVQVLLMQWNEVANFTDTKLIINNITGYIPSIIIIILNIILFIADFRTDNPFRRRNVLNYKYGSSRREKIALQIHVTYLIHFTISYTHAHIFIFHRNCTQFASRNGLV